MAWMDETLPSYVLLLICMLTLPLCISLTGTCFSSMSYIYFRLHLWVSCFLNVFDTLCPLALNSSIFRAPPTHSLYSQWLSLDCCGWHAYSLAFSPCVLPFSLFCACGYSLFVSVCVLFCSHLCVHHWVVCCVHCLLSVSVQQPVESSKDSLPDTPSQTQSDSEKT